MNIRTFFRDLGWTGAGIGTALGIDYLFYVATGRLLGPEAFGAFGVIMAVYYVVVASPFRALEMTAKRMAASGDAVWAVLTHPTAAIGTVAGIAAFLAAPYAAAALQVPVTAVRVFAFVFPVAYVAPVGIGVLHGRERFRPYAAYEVVTSLARFSMLAAVATVGLAGAVLGPVVELWVGAGILVAVLGLRSARDRFDAFPLLGRSLVYIAAVHAAFSVDILLLQQFFDGTTVGRYTAVSVLGKAVYFGAVAVNRSVFAKLVDGEAWWRMLHLSLGVIVAGGATAAAVLAVAGRPILTITFGPAYGAAASFAPLYMAFITLVAVTALLGNAYLARDDPRIWLILGLPLAEVGLIILSHTSVVAVVRAGSIAAAGTAAVMYLVLLRDRLAAG